MATRVAVNLGIAAQPSAFGTPLVHFARNRLKGQRREECAWEPIFTGVYVSEPFRTFHRISAMLFHGVQGVPSSNLGAPTSTHERSQKSGGWSHLFRARCVPSGPCHEPGNLGQNLVESLQVPSCQNSKRIESALRSRYSGGHGCGQEERKVRSSGDLRRALSRSPSVTARCTATDPASLARRQGHSSAIETLGRPRMLH